MVRYYRMDTKSPESRVLRSLSRLSYMIKLILKAWTPRMLIVQQEQVAAQNTSKKPTILELATTENKRKLTEKIQQRLLQRSGTPGSSVPGTVLSDETQHFLTCPPWNRSIEGLEKAHKELQICHTFNDYPVAIQKSICKQGWYQQLAANRVIYTTGYEPTCYYLVLSGTVAEVGGSVLHSSHIGNVINTYPPGSSFGDTDIIDRNHRISSCYAQDQVELFVISRSDYVDLSLRQSKRSYQDNKHFSFCRTVSLLKQWPLDELSSAICSQSYYKPRAVIVKDSRKSDYIFVVMSGSCRVVKRFIDNSSSTSQPKTHQKALTGDTSAKPPLSTQSPLSTQLHMSAATDHDNNSEFHKLRDRRATFPSFQDGEKNKGKPILVQLQLLQPKDIFGLSSMLYEDEPSVSLVSNGSECILIAKSFIKLYMGDRSRRWLYKQVQQFPSQETMLKRIREHHSWNIYKQTLVSHLKKKHS
ncbi:cyclic nucleotide-binding domain-containing protein 2-like [Dysidea avara]|uniref:cyclic nucleotide-binding domain-containing protein 2-like n=1 Tax=Dysidea avara TaxID=196820 RepID=UPI00332BB944